MNPDFGSKHLTGLLWLFSLIAILLAVTLTVKYKYKRGESYDRRVIRYVCYFMWALEIIKTIRMVNCSDYGPIGYYPLWMAPFHICSMGLYAYLIIGSKRAGKLAEWVAPFGYAVMLVVTCIILTIPNSSGILGTPTDWSFVFDNILPYQSFLYHGCLVFVPLYMAFSGLYKPRWSDIYKGAIVGIVVATFAQTLNYVLEGSDADFMTLRYGRGNPFAFMIDISPVLYCLFLVVVVVACMAIVIGATIGIRKLIEKRRQR